MDCHHSIYDTEYWTAFNCCHIISWPVGTSIVSGVLMYIVTIVYTLGDTYVKEAQWEHTYIPSNITLLQFLSPRWRGNRSDQCGSWFSCLFNITRVNRLTIPLLCTLHCQWHAQCREVIGPIVGGALVEISDFPTSSVVRHHRYSSIHSCLTVFTVSSSLFPQLATLHATRSWVNYC